MSIGEFYSQLTSSLNSLKTPNGSELFSHNPEVLTDLRLLISDAVAHFSPHSNSRLLLDLKNELSGLLKTQESPNDIRKVLVLLHGISSIVYVPYLKKLGITSQAMVYEMARVSVYVVLIEFLALSTLDRAFLLNYDSFLDFFMTRERLQHLTACFAVAVMTVGVNPKED